MIPEGAAIILGGGRSSRIGREKGLLKLDNRAVFEIVLTKMKCLFEEIILVTNTPSLFDGDKDFRIVTDEVPYQGPLGGILAGLSVSSKKYNFVVAYDMPFLNTDLVEFLFTRISGADVVIPSSEKGIEPLFAIYSKDCIPAIRKKLEGGQRRVISFFGEVKVERVDQDKVGRFDPQYLSFFNVNTPKDWEKAQRIYQSQKEKNDV